MQQEYLWVRFVPVPWWHEKLDFHLLCHIPYCYFLLWHSLRGLSLHSNLFWRSDWLWQMRCLPLGFWLSMLAIFIDLPSINSLCSAAERDLQRTGMNWGCLHVESSCAAHEIFHVNCQIFHMTPVSKDLKSGLFQHSSHIAQHAFMMAKSTWKFLGGRLQEPEEHSSVRIYGLCNTVERGE